MGDSRVVVSVLNLNIRFGFADDGPDDWRFRKSAFAPLLAAYPADFLTFQEVNPFQAEFLRSLLPGHGMIGLRRPAPEFWQNNVIFHDRRWKCLIADHFFLSPTPDLPSRSRDSRWPRQCIVGKFRRNDRLLLFATTHFDFEPSVQTTSARILLNRLKRHVGEEFVRTIVTGDFNAGPASSCHDVLTINDGGFHDAFEKSHDGTYHGFTGNPTGERIDWILYRGNLSPIQRTVVRERFNARHPSDHFPLHVRFSWQNRSA